MIGTVQVAGLALGFLFLSLYGGDPREPRVDCSSARSSGSPATRCSDCSRVRCSRRCSSSRSPGGRSSSPRSTRSAAAARGVPVRLLEPAFLVVLGLAVAATAQITGVLLVFALLVAPAACRAAADRAESGSALALTVVYRAGHHLDRAHARLLHQLLGRLLRHLARLRRLRRGVPPASSVLTHEFIRNALLAGSAIAIASGAVGYFVVLRAQVFAGDALSHVAFTGVLAAAAAGIDLRVGLFAATIAVALLLRGARRARSEATTSRSASIFVWVLGPRRPVPRPLQPSARGATASSPRARCSARSSVWHRAGRRSSPCRSRRRRRSRRLAGIARPLLFATIAPADRRRARRAGRARSAARSSCCSRSTRARRRRRSARCCCSGSSRPRPAPRCASRRARHSASRLSVVLRPRLDLGRESRPPT